MDSGLAWDLGLSLLIVVAYAPIARGAWRRLRDRRAMNAREERESTDA